MDLCIQQDMDMWLTNYFMITREKERRAKRKKNKQILHAIRANNTVNVNERNDLPMKMQKENNNISWNGWKKNEAIFGFDGTINGIKQANKICENDCMKSIAQTKNENRI